MSSSEHKIMTPEERAAKFVPPWEKDVCTDLLVELNACRRKNLYWRGSCEHELHAYEKCEYRDILRRMKEAEDMKAAGMDMAKVYEEYARRGKY